MLNFLKIIVLSALLVGCVSCGGGEVKEVRRISNPIGTIDAIVAIRETGATVATPTEIYIEPKGVAIKGVPVFRADNVDGLSVYWSGDKSLFINAATARVFLEPKKAQIGLGGKAGQVTVGIKVNERL